MKKLLALFGLNAILTISLELIEKEIKHLQNKDYISDEEAQKRALKIRLLNNLKNSISEVLQYAAGKS